MAPATVACGTIETPMGPFTAAVASGRLLRLAFPDEEPDGVREELIRRLALRPVDDPRAFDPLRTQIEDYFDGRLRRFRTRLDWSLVGPFARRVLEATAAIPYGGWLSYGEIAAEAGSPGGARAAGNALGSNPFALVVPCHRVIASGGAIGGYGGGIERKRFLLELERTFSPGAARARR